MKKTGVARDQGKSVRSRLSRWAPPLIGLGLLSLLLSACPAPGPTLSFTGTYIGTFGIREAAQLPEAWRVPSTLTAVLTQTGNSVSGDVTSSTSAGTATISAMVSTPGNATGSFDPPGPPPPTTINLFLTAADQDLVMQIPDEGNLAIVLERQP